MNWLTRFKALFVLTYTGFLGNIAVIYYLSRGLSYSEIGLATAFSALGFFLFEVPTGVVGDRVSRKTSVLIGLSIYPLSLLLLLFLRNFWMLLVSELISVLGASFISGSLQAWFFDNLKSEGREGEFKEIWRSIQKATVLASSSTTIAGAFMAQLWGFEVPILLSLILHLTMIPLTWSIPEMGFSKLETSYTSHVIHSFRELLKPEVFWLITYLLTVTLSLTQFRNFFEPYLGEVLAKSLGTTIMGTLGILGIVEVLTRTAPRYAGIALKGRSGRLLHETAPVAIPLSTLLSVLYPNAVFIIALGIMATLFASAFTFNFSVEFQRRIPSEKRATILSLRNMVLAIVSALFYAVYGFVVQHMGLRKARLMFALLFLAFGASFKLAQLGPLGKYLVMGEGEKE
ncbi:MFS transporter [Thermococcus peptonophilus]|uniref:MFS transporter permease n=1 Tax=Thermococcus peptonophilus TaxID=53952 RepID=A0A142CT34_9EURY|nr:MFS transporter [Thermococcus peptonophilus]AMQ17936.1 MFS transporter permease [Thermococcus peptonophilus]